MLRRLLRRVTPLRVLYRFAFAVLLKGQSIRVATAYAFERPFLDSQDEALALRIGVATQISRRASEDEVAWRITAGRWAKRNRGNTEPEARREAFAALLHTLRPRSLIEVGCSYGENLTRFARGATDIQVAGIDVGVAPLQAAEATLRGRLLCGSAYALPIADRSFDVSCTMWVFCHLPPTDVQHALNELTRISRRYIVLVEYFDECVPEGASHMGLDFRIYNHNYAEWASTRSDFQLLHMGPTAGAPSNTCSVTFLLKRCDAD